METDYPAELNTGTSISQSIGSSNETALSGMKEICQYVGKSEKTIKKYIADEQFPANKIGGIWESDRILIDDWRVARIGIANL